MFHKLYFYILWLYIEEMLSVLPVHYCSVRVLLDSFFQFSSFIRNQKIIRMSSFLLRRKYALHWQATVYFMYVSYTRGLIVLFFVSFSFRTSTGCKRMFSFSHLSFYFSILQTVLNVWRAVIMW